MYILSDICTLILSICSFTAKVWSKINRATRQTILHDHGLIIIYKSKDQIKTRTSDADDRNDMTAKITLRKAGEHGHKNK